MNNYELLIVPMSYFQTEQSIVGPFCNIGSCIIFVFTQYPDVKFHVTVHSNFPNSNVTIIVVICNNIHDMKSCESPELVILAPNWPFASRL